MGIDWTKSMQQAYEFYEVDPWTWKDKRKLSEIKSCTISRDFNTETLYSASVDTTESLGEMYIRAYMVPIQNGEKYKIPLATVLVQTPSESFDGMVKSFSLDAYSPLIELKDDYPPIGYSVLKGENIMDKAVALCKEHLRAPVIAPTDSTKTLDYSLIADVSENWLSFISALIRKADFIFDIDENGQIMFAPIQETKSLKPKWIYDDSNSSILYPSISVERDLYGIPNVVEVIYSTESGYLYSKVTNDDNASLISTVNRGREIVYRESNPSFYGVPTQAMIDEYAIQLLEQLSTLEYKVSYSHGYSPAKIGECVLLNYEKANIKNTKVRILTQSISCSSGCQVSETAVYATKLWR